MFSQNGKKNNEIIGSKMKNPFLAEKYEGFERIRGMANI